MVVDIKFDVEKRETLKQTAKTNLYRMSIFPIEPSLNTKHNTTFQNVHLHEDQLETVMSVLEESNVEIRHNLHDLLSSCQLNSQVSCKLGHEILIYLKTCILSWF